MVVRVSLSKGKSCIVDDEDAAWLSQYSWYFGHPKGRPDFGYARHSVRVREGETSVIFMHRLIAGALPGQKVDHKDGDTLNNTRANLRIANKVGNQQNKGKMTSRPTASRYKGVSYNKRRRKWIAYVGGNAKREHLGYFASETEAAQAYNEAALHRFGEFARLNDV